MYYRMLSDQTLKNLKILQRSNVYIAETTVYIQSKIGETTSAHQRIKMYKTFHKKNSMYQLEEIRESDQLSSL